MAKNGIVETSAALRDTPAGRQMQGNSISTGKITKDSLDPAAKMSDTIARPYHRALLERRYFIQHTNADMPNKNTSDSLRALIHMMASWCPSKTAKRPALQKAISWSMISLHTHSA